MSDHDRPTIVQWRDPGCPLDWMDDGRSAARVRMSAPVYELASDELEQLGLSPETLAACRRVRGRGFDYRMEQLELAGLIRLGDYDQEQLDMPVEVLLRRQLGRAVLAVAFGPVNRSVLELYWDCIHEYGAGDFWAAEFLVRGMG